MDWRIIGLSFAIFFILEGVMPLCFPDSWKRLLGELAIADQVVLRRLGGCFVVTGLTLLYIFLIRG